MKYLIALLDINKELTGATDVSLVGRHDTSVTYQRQI